MRAGGSLPLFHYKIDNFSNYLPGTTIKSLLLLTGEFVRLDSLLHLKLHKSILKLVPSYFKLQKIAPM